MIAILSMIDDEMIDNDFDNNIYMNDCFLL